MSDHTSIEWTDSTWNPLVGCSRVSQGCVNCYAERHAYRFARLPGTVYEGTAKLVNGKPTFTGRVNVATRSLDQPMRWKRPRRIFVNSMSDLFHESVSDGTIIGLFAVMAASPQHQFQILTKRPERMLEWFTRVDAMARGDHGTILHEAAKGLFGYTDRRRPVIQADSVRWPLPNTWLGVSVEDQAAADERIPLLLKTPAHVRFLSCEPLLGPINLREVVTGTTPTGWRQFVHALTGHGCSKRIDRVFERAATGLLGPAPPDSVPRSPGIDWVIAGGESGPRARPMHPDWVRSLRDTCAGAGVPFFFKQWGEWAPADELSSEMQEHYDVLGRTSGPMARVGKKAAGRKLDGREYRAFPDIADSPTP